ncbi:MAG: NADH-quinone oxidoreductase subunit J, partial [Steroidobacteraceae bacterium]
IGPAVLTAILLAELIYMLWQGGGAAQTGAIVTPRQVGALLFGPYLLAVELASLLLLAGLIAAYHIGRETERASEKQLQEAPKEPQGKVTAQ